MQIDFFCKVQKFRTSISKSVLICLVAIFNLFMQNISPHSFDMVLTWMAATEHCSVTCAVWFYYSTKWNTLAQWSVGTTTLEQGAYFQRQYLHLFCIF